MGRDQCRRVKDQRLSPKAGEVGHDLKVGRKIRWNQKVMSLKSGKGTISERGNYQLTNESGKRRAE